MNNADAPAPPEIRAEELALTRGEKRLFQALSFRLGAGSALLVRGANGAGKSSLLLSLAEIVRPDSGRVTYRNGGADLPIAENIHFLGHLSGVKPRLTLNENLAFWRVLLGRPARTNAEALERVGLAGLGDIEAGHLSAGQTRRLALARLLVAHRPLWLLDEPTAALDAAGHNLVAAMLEAHCRTGGLAIVATHDELPVPGITAQTIILGTA